MNNRFQIIHLGNPYDFVVKDHKTNRTYGTFQGDDKSMLEMLTNFYEENEQLKKENERLYKQINYLKRVIYNNEPKIFVQSVFNNLEKIE